MKRCYAVWMCLATMFADLPSFSSEIQSGRDPRNPLDQGGDICNSALPILTRPFCDTGTTVGYTDDYASPCAPGIHAPDVVYTMIVPTTTVITVSLCGSSYNTALTVWRNCPSSGGTLVCCSDDVCGDDACCSVTLLPGAFYFFVVDGAGTTNNSGEYLINVVNGADTCPSTICAPGFCDYDSVDIEPNNTCQDPSGIIACGDTLCGFMEPNGNDFHFFVVLGPGWSWVTIDVFGDDTPGWYPYQQGLNPRFEVQSCSEVYVAASDGGVGNDARIEGYCLSAGVYLLRVAAEPQSNSGPYIIATSCEPCLNECPYTSTDYEPFNGTCAETFSQVTCGDTVCGSFLDADSIDYYEFEITGTSPKRVFIDVFGNDTPGYFTFGQGLDPELELIPEGCSGFIATDANGGVGNDARLDTLCLQPGFYKIRVSSAFQGLDGPYILAVSCAPCECDYPNLDIEPNGTCNGGGGGTIVLGDTVCGNQELGSNDYYFFNVPGPTCKIVSIDVFGNDTPGFYPFNRGMNPAVSLYGIDGTCYFIGSDDNSGIGADARLDSPCLAPGNYRLQVSAQPQGSNSGPYVIATSYSLCPCATCNYPNGDDEFNDICGSYAGGSITCGDTACGLITPDSGPDHLNFVVLGFECKVVTIDAFGDDTPGFFPFGQGLNTHLILFDHDVDTVCVSLYTDDNDGVGTDARIVACLDPGTYRLRISNGTSATFGPWIIATSCVPCNLTECGAPDSVVIHYPAALGVGDPLQDVELYWPAVPDADEYRIYRSSDNNNPVIVTPANLVAATANTFFVHENVVAYGGSNEVWIYQIVAVCNSESPCVGAALRTPDTDEAAGSNSVDE